MKPTGGIKTKFPFVFDLIMQVTRFRDTRFRESSDRRRKSMEGSRTRARLNVPVNDKLQYSELVKFTFKDKSIVKIIHARINSINNARQYFQI